MGDWNEQNEPKSIKYTTLDMADSLDETKITIQPEEEEVASLVYPYEQITIDYEKTSTKA